MPKTRKKTSPGLVGDADLAAQSQRVLAAGRSVLGADIVDDEQAIALSRAIAGRLAAMPLEARLAKRRSLVSLIDDLAQLSARLTAEKARVEQHLRLQSSHAAAGRAYRTGEVR